MQIVYIETDYGAIHPNFKQFNIYQYKDTYVIKSSDIEQIVEMKNVIKDIQRVKEQKCYISVQYMLSNLWSK